MSPEFWLQVAVVMASGACSALTVYVGIKVDLALTRAKAEQAEKSADAAHKRLDNCIQGCGK